MAPEVHDARNTPCNAKTADIFSLGILFFILAFGAPPFHSADKSDTYFRYLKLRPMSLDFFKFHPHTRQLYREGVLEESFLILLLSMLCADPAQRAQDAGMLL